MCLEDRVKITRRVKKEKEKEKEQEKREARAVLMIIDREK